MFALKQYQVLLYNIIKNNHFEISLTHCGWDKMAAILQLTFLTHWGQDKMAAVSRTMFSNTFSWMKMYEFCLKFHRSLFLRFQSTIFQHWFRYLLDTGQASNHYLNQWWLVYWRICASLGLNELNAIFLMQMYELRLKFHLSLFLRLQLTIFQHWFRKWHGAKQATRHYLNQW